MEEIVEFSALVGEHLLDAVDTWSDQVKPYESADYTEEANCIGFRLDGKVYVCIEDPSDGYRSSMRTMIVSERPMTNTFVPVRVLARLKDKGENGQENDTLQLINVVNGQIVLEAGTDNSDDYYPWFVSFFDPAAIGEVAP